MEYPSPSKREAHCALVGSNPSIPTDFFQKKTHHTMTPDELRAKLNFEKNQVVDSAYKEIIGAMTLPENITGFDPITVNYSVRVAYNENRQFVIDELKKRFLAKEWNVEIFEETPSEFVRFYFTEKTNIPTLLNE